MHTQHDINTKFVVLTLGADSVQCPNGLEVLNIRRISQTHPGWAPKPCGGPPQEKGSQYGFKRRDAYGVGFWRETGCIQVLEKLQFAPATSGTCCVWSFSKKRFRVCSCSINNPIHNFLNFLSERKIVKKVSNCQNCDGGGIQCWYKTLVKCKEGRRNFVSIHYKIKFKETSWWHNFSRQSKLSIEIQQLQKQPCSNLKVCHNYNLWCVYNISNIIMSYP